MGRILIVEDDPIVRNGLLKIARSIDEGMEVLVTGYAEQALNYIKDRYFDAFFLDIQLKDYSGLLLAEEIRAIYGYELTPIVFITAIPVYELKAFRSIHCYDYIIKPFNEEKIRKVFETIIKHGVKKDDNKAILKAEQKHYTYIINQDDIIYIESINRKIFIKTIHERILLSTYTLNRLINDLTEDFIQCHRGYIVNTKYIKKIDKTNKSIVMRGIETQVPIGRKYKDELRGKGL